MNGFKGLNGSPRLLGALTLLPAAALVASCAYPAPPTTSKQDRSRCLDQFGWSADDKGTEVTWGEVGEAEASLPGASQETVVTALSAVVRRKKKTFAIVCRVTDEGYIDVSRERIRKKR